jgi:hypothetical protein
VKTNLPFFLIVYIYIAVGKTIVKMGRVGIPLTGFTLPHVCAYPKTKQDLDFQCQVMVFLIFNDLRKEVAVTFKHSFHNCRLLCPLV